MKYNISFDKPLYIKCIFDRPFVSHEGSGITYHIIEDIFVRVFSQPLTKKYQIVTRDPKYSQSYVISRINKCCCNFEKICQYKMDPVNINSIITRLMIQPEYYFDTVRGIVDQYWNIFNDVYIRPNSNKPQNSLMIVSKTKNHSKEEILNKFEELLLNQL